MSSANRKFLDHDWYDQPLPKNVSIGQGSWLYSSYAFRHYQSKQSSGVMIGDDTGLYNGTFFDLGTNGTVSIGNYCSIVGAIFCTNKKIIIQDYVFIAHEVVLADTAYEYPAGRDIDTSKKIISSPMTSIEIQSNAWIGMRAVLLEGACIGEGAIIGAGAVVDFEVPANSIVAGSPSKIVGWINK